MQLFNIIALLASVAVAAPTLAERDGPSGHEVQIQGFTYGGSGCPANTVGSMLSDDRTTLTLIYDQFIAQAGKGIEPKERRKNCQVNVKLHYPQGWQYSVFKADYRGHATLPAGAKGTTKATYYFSGSSQQVSRAQYFNGPYNADYLKTDAFAIESTVWSPCGAEGMLNVNSAVQLDPLDSEKAALLTSESTDLKFKQICYLQWRKCSK
ncbi:hypothetical protein C8A03DRAFT_15021 [Achaetomium macrosporum]|uniref:Secreted protein n=1 Tax=Achaetomium macrosporum TaxID=79813 RepID=A0AAN7H7C2_9PEZI|nr:hypothetical protein C8A03DRAFT_15021 [Achaetomium macrosporum]